MKSYHHGEVGIYQRDKLPKGLKKVKSKEDKYILADSETTGNHHCLENKPGVELFREDEDGILWMKTSVPVDVFCVIKERHDTITLEPGVYEIDKAKEYNYLNDEVMNVAD